ncbi:MAG: ATP-binding protein [Gammaproteobacteria bacterium]|nr:ATP-binding protein [Gammaproteobacteria bacterium]
MIRFSLEGKLALVLSISAVLTVAVTAILFLSIDNTWVALLVALTLTVTLSVLVAQRAAAPIRNLILALRDGVSGLKDGDFSTSIAKRRNDELGKLVGVYNELGDVLRRERQSLFQRELLLDTVIQTTPLALVLVNPSDRVVYSNTAARELFRGGKALNGKNFSSVLNHIDEGFARAVNAGRDGLFTISEDDEPHTYHLSLRNFELNAQPHQLYLFKQLTHELSRQEVATWKKVIRLISHELNNSLAPISSLAHSGGIILQNPNQDKLADIFATIEERSLHLKTFIEGYARFARLPAPRLQDVDINAFVEMLSHTVNFNWSTADTYGDMQADQVQLEQVFINLLKNAHESGSAPEDVELVITPTSRQVRFEVHDRGAGMSDQVMKNALLPFYSTKQKGTGLGLPLCREIVEAHDGRLSIANREGGGTTVSVTLPKNR